MKKLYFGLFAGLILLILPVQSQNRSGFWQDASESQLDGDSRQIHPSNYRTLSIDEQGLLEEMSLAPMEFTEAARTQAVEISLPMPDGSYQRFRMVESPIMAPDLANKYPWMKTWTGQGIDDPQAALRMDHTQKGFHAMILRPDGAVFIDPYNPQTTQHYLSYYKRDFLSNNQSEWKCLVKTAEVSTTSPSAARSTGEELRTYRLAMAATGEYTAFHGGTVVGALAAIVTSVNRVVGVYEMEVAVRMELVANTDLLIYTSAGSDPYTNNNGPAMLGQNQTNVDNLIGSANYDIGHVFSTGGGGIAGFGVVCSNNSKARGVTGLFAPVGDPFDIDYVAHEIGHQFRGSHTFNGTSGSCAGNRTSSAAYEPGSGSTIMAYAGICGGDNIQNFSNPYFHSHSFDQITSYTQTGNGSNCPVVTNTGNQIPVVEEVPAGGFFIPISTPFVLAGKGSDPDGDAITYGWEQFNLGPAGSPNSPSGNAPIFRSFSPTDTNARTFPRIQNIIANNTGLGERYPTYSRDMTFRMTVRDNRAGGGGVASDVVSFEATALAGPFRVTQPNSFLSWTAGFYQQVSWDVANTHLPPVNCSEVNIVLSRDGGFTYPDTLAMNVPNTGSYTLLVPDLPGTQNRIRIQASDNIFFDISNTNFTIVLPTQAGFTFYSPEDEITACIDSDTEFSILTTSLLGFSELIGLSASAIPAGVTASFAQDSVVPGDDVSLQLSISDSATAGSYFIGVVGQTQSGQASNQILTLTLVEGAPATLTALDAPANGASGIAASTSFSWPSVPNATGYGLQVSTSPIFAAGDIVLEVDGIGGNAYTSPNPLSDFTIYYWRVRAENLCGVGPYSDLFAFQTGVCQDITSTNVPVTIPAFGNPAVATSTINMMLTGSLTDVKVQGLQGTHEAVSELTATLTSPGLTTITLFSGICDDGLSQNFEFGFSDGGLDSINCPATDGNTYQPVDAFSAFAGEQAQGTWTLRVEDAANFNSGEIQAWSLQLCQEGFAAPELITNEPLLLNRWFRDTINQSLLEATTAGVGPANHTFTLLSLPADGVVELDEVPMTIGQTFTQADVNDLRITYLHYGDTIPQDEFLFDVQNNAGGWIGTFTYRINITITTALSSLSQEQLQVFPNPSRGKVQVSMNLPGVQGEAVIQVLSLHGQRLQSHRLPLRGSQTTQELTIEDYAAGIYLIDIQTPSGRRIEKIILTD